jgi:hypothetical protein
MMPIAFVLDEHLRGKPIWHAIRHHNLGGGLLIDTTRVGDPPDLPLGSSDPDILAWAERAGRIILTEDAKTFPSGLGVHLRAGGTSPGVFLILPSATISSVLSGLELVVADNRPDTWRAQVTYIP